MIKYLYLDDGLESQINPYIRQIENQNTDINIVWRHPSYFDAEIEKIESEIKEDYDGLILDLRLDEKTEEGNRRANFQAPALAQELRTRASKEIKINVPIVLWSTDQKLKDSFYPDDTAKDLFDLVSIKSDVKQKNLALIISKQLISLVYGYRETGKILKQKRKGKSLSTEEKTRQLLGLKNKDEFLDPRVLNHVVETKNSDSLEIHKFARFILKEMVESQGPLVDELVLAARLGIDKDKSLDWQKLKIGFLSEFAYHGVFSKGWERWWAYLLEDWWKTKLKSHVLKSSNADERTKELKKYTGLKDLIAAKPMVKSYDNRFWTICQVERKPLAPSDGLIIKQNNKKPWQDFLYISPKVYKSERLGKYEIDPLELQKL